VLLGYKRFSSFQRSSRARLVAPRLQTLFNFFIGVCELVALLLGFLRLLQTIFDFSGVCEFVAILFSA
jgi:hypothetical protein